MRLNLVVLVLLTAAFAQSPTSKPAPPQLAHFHHVHLNATDPKADIDTVHWLEMQPRPG